MDEMRAEPLVYENLPLSADNTNLLGNEHPPAWVNPKPKRRYDLVVLGAGPAGLISAITAASKGAKVALVEKDLIGGECFNVGCIPSKSIIRTSRLYADMRNADAYGACVPHPTSIDFSAAMRRMERIRSQVSGRISVNEIKKKNIDVFFGHAKFSSENVITVTDVNLKFRKAIVATGSRPLIPEIPGIETIEYLTNETIFNLKERPESLLVIGGGPLGCELAQAYARLGSKVTIVQCDPMFLDNVERDGAQLLSNALASDGVDIHLNSDVTSMRAEGDKKIVEIVNTGYVTTITVTHVLIGTGQKPNTNALGLAAAKINCDKVHGIIVDAYLRTSNPKVYAVGNVCGEEKYVHIPDALAKAATANALFGGRHKVADHLSPWCIYTDPEIAHVGLQVKEAREAKIPVKTFTTLMHQVDRAIADSEDTGFVKIHVREGTDKILGATVVSRHAGDMITGISLAIQSGIGLAHFAAINYPYPTQGNAIRAAALAYQNTCRPSVLQWIRRQLFRS